MRIKDIYAVVDLETTQTVTAEGQIIQIAIAFVQNQKVINQFSTLVNPGKKIPDNITKLTGITDAMVASAPYFKDVAMSIYAMLQGTVIVAHNIEFDLPFLNYAFEQVGITPLKNRAIDTVQLSQILWPTAPGFRLMDLTQYLNFEHDHPHQADSDALATAKLLIAIQKRAVSLPMVTLQALVDLPLALARDSKTILEQALVMNQAQPEPLPKQLQVIDGLAIRRFSAPAPLGMKKDYKYPAKKAALEQIFGQGLTYRSQQAKLMNRIYQHYQADECSEGALVLEAPTGMGKTLGYLLPYAYLANEQERQVVVSVPTITLQQQVVNSVNTQLNSLLPFEVRAVSLKGRRHFLNLQSFKRSIHVDEGSANLQFIKAQILVWLTETLTGDLDELNLNNASQQFMVKLTQGANNPAGSNFYGHEFWERQSEQAAAAQFLVVNHAYLATYAKTLTSERKPFLLVDEAQQLPDAVIEQSRLRLDFDRWRAQGVYAYNLLATDMNDSLQPIIKRLAGGQQIRQQFTNQLQALIEIIPRLKTNLYRTFLLSQHTPPTEGQRQQALDTQALAQFWVTHQDDISQLNRITQQLNDLLDDLMDTFAQANHAFSLAERQLLADFRRLLGSLNADMDKVNQFQQELVDFPHATVFWLTETVRQEENHIVLSGGLLHTFDFFKTRIYPYFMSPTLIGATLFTSTKSSYLYDRLNIDADQAESYVFPETFDYQQQARMFIAKDAPGVNDGEYARYLAQQVVELTTSLHENTLVLFTSHEMLQVVYTMVHNNQQFIDSDMMVLAQGISGGKQRLLKRLQTEKKLVVFGTASFWDGVDLPDDKLRLVILARLPFEQPENIVQQAEEQMLIANHREPFYQNTLPKAVLRLRQGVGRLIRSPRDYGAIVLYDNRMFTRKYGKTFQKMLPKGLEQNFINSNEILRQVKEFFNEQRK